MKPTIFMTFREKAAGWMFFFLQLSPLPTLLILLNELLPVPGNDTQINCVHYMLCFAAVVIIFRKFLWTSLRNSLKEPVFLLKTVFLGVLVYFGGNHLVSLLSHLLIPAFHNVNDQNVAGMIQQQPALLSICVVLLVPVTEELLYRGLIFGTLCQKNRVLGYVLSTAAFCSIHVIGYISTAPIFLLLLNFLQYIPAGLTLAWAYRKANSIWAPILMHITINLIGILSMR